VVTDNKPEQISIERDGEEIKRLAVYSDSIFYDEDLILHPFRMRHEPG
jgi:hypothetical protein